MIDAEARAGGAIALAVGPVAMGSDAGGGSARIMLML